MPSIWTVQLRYNFAMWRRGRAVEGTSLENWQRGNPFVSSNLTASEFLVAEYGPQEFRSHKFRIPAPLHSAGSSDAPELLPPPVGSDCHSGRPLTPQGDGGLQHHRNPGLSSGREWRRGQGDHERKRKGPESKRRPFRVRGQIASDRQRGQR